MPEYAALQATANRLVNDAGRTLTARKFSTTPTNASEPWDGNSRSASATVSFIGVFVQPSSALKLGMTTLSPDLFNALENIVICGQPTTGEDLSTFDEISDGSVYYKIVFKEKLKPGDTTLLYFLGVAR